VLDIRLHLRQLNGHVTHHVQAGINELRGKGGRAIGACPARTRSRRVRDLWPGSFPGRCGDANRLVVVIVVVVVILNGFELDLALAGGGFGRRLRFGLGFLAWFLISDCWQTVRLGW